MTEKFYTFTLKDASQDSTAANFSDVLARQN